jgi:cation diffusion facilitator family transporter
MRMGRAEKLAAGSIAVGCLVLTIKAAAWWITGSAALYSDALESVVNIVASIVAFAALRLSAKPADANHPFGHMKVEFLSAVVEGALIVIAAVSILQHAWATWLVPRPLALPWIGLTLNALGGVVNGIWATILMRAGRTLRSPALIADARHLTADVVTSAGIVVGLGLAVLTGILELDPLLAAVTALAILRSGVRMMRESVGGLMDEAPAGEVVDRVRALVAQNADGALEAHDLRMRRAGRFTFLEFHLVVPASMSVADAHDICDRLEHALKTAMEELVITIHVEPEGKAKHRDALVL